MFQTTIWVVAVLFWVVLIIIVLSSFRVMMANDFPTKIELLKPANLKTGDLLTVAYRHAFGWFVTLWSESVWTHTGIVWKEPDTNETYILEAANYGGKWNGVFKIPFNTWIRINKTSDIAINRLEITGGKKLDTDLLRREFDKIRGIKLDRINIYWYRLLFRTKWTDEPNAQARTCYELVIKVLQKTGIMQKKYAGSSYFTRDIVWGHVEMEEGFKYSRPVLADPRLYVAQLAKQV